MQCTKYVLFVCERRRNACVSCLDDVCFFSRSVSLPISILSADFQADCVNVPASFLVLYAFAIARNGIAFFWLVDLMSFEDIMNDTEQKQTKQRTMEFKEFVNAHQDD